jgi:hypothetical protein
MFSDFLLVFLPRQYTKVIIDKLLSSASFDESILGSHFPRRWSLTASAYNFHVAVRPELRETTAVGTMKISGSLALFSLARLSFQPVAALAATTSGTMEVDIVFPRANQTYPRVYPFPVVVAVQNPDLAQMYDLTYVVSIHSLSAQDRLRDGSVSYLYPDQATEIGQPPFHYAEFNSSSASYQIFNFDTVVHSTGWEWVVYYTVGHSRNCTAPSSEGGRPAYTDLNSTVFDGTVHFELSNDEGGELPSSDEWLAQGDGDGCGTTAFTSNVKEGLTNRFNAGELGV